MPRASETLRKRYEDASTELHAFFSTVEKRVKAGGDAMSTAEREKVEGMSTRVDIRKEDLEAQLELERVAGETVTSGVARTAEGNVVTVEAISAELGVSATEAIGALVKSQLTRQPVPETVRELYVALGHDDVFTERGNILVIPKLLQAAREEERAKRAATGTTQSTYSSYAGAVSPFVRPMEVTDALGIQPQSVIPGRHKANYLATSPDSSFRAEDTDLVALATEQAVINANELAPRRIASGRGFTVESNATYGDLGQTIMGDAVAATMAEVQKQVVNGTVATGWAGLFLRAGLGRAIPTSVDTFATSLQAFSAMIDGTYASELSDLRCLMSSDAHAFLSSLFPAASGDVSAGMHLSERTSAFKVSSYAPGVVTSGNSKTHGILVRRGLVPDAVAWFRWGLELSVNPYSSQGVGVTIAAWCLDNLYVPTTGDDARSDWVIVNIREATA